MAPPDAVQLGVLEAGDPDTRAFFAPSLALCPHVTQPLYLISCVPSRTTLSGPADAYFRKEHRIDVRSDARLMCGASPAVWLAGLLTLQCFASVSAGWLVYCAHFSAYSDLLGAAARPDVQVVARFVVADDARQRETSRYSIRLSLAVVNVRRVRADLSSLLAFANRVHRYDLASAAFLTPPLKCRIPECLSGGQLVFYHLFSTLSNTCRLVLPTGLIFSPTF